MIFMAVQFGIWLYIYKPWNLGKNHQGQPKNYWAFFQVPTILFSEVGMMEIRKSVPEKWCQRQFCFLRLSEIRKITPFYPLWDPPCEVKDRSIDFTDFTYVPMSHRHVLSGQGHKANSPVGSGASAHGHCCVSIANKTRSCPQKNRQPRVKTTKMTKIATDSTIPTNCLNKYWWLWWHGNGDDHEISWKCDNFPESEAKNPNCLLGSL